MKFKINDSEYTYQCVMCGNCCRMGWYIPITRQDLDLWNKKGKLEYHSKIQVDPRAISIVGINEGFGGYSLEWDGDFMERVIEDMSSVNRLKDNYKAEEVYNFVLENHDYVGEGKYRYHALLGFIYKYPAEYNWTWPIFIPKSLEVVYKGMDVGLDYIIISDLKNQCEFLEDNSCSIHSIKPNICRIFPFEKIEGELKMTLFEEFEKICSGLKKCVKKL